MRWLLKIFYLLLFIVLVLALIAFLNANPEAHQLKFLGWQLMQTTVGTSILLALAMGIFIGLAAGMPLILGLRIQIKRMQKRLSENLRSDSTT